MSEEKKMPEELMDEELSNVSGGKSCGNKNVVCQECLNREGVHHMAIEVNSAGSFQRYYCDRKKCSYDKNWHFMHVN